MLLRRFLKEETGCASYLFGCLTTGQLGVVDPHADLVDEYVAVAKAKGARISQVFDTHVHADHLSGARELARHTGAALRLPEDSPVEFEFEPLHDREVVRLGRTKVEAIDSPGHTWAHSCLLVTDTSRGDDPWLVFTGDTLLVGTVGRPDLHGEERELARALHHTLRERLLTLPDWIEILPGHVSGSACGVGISSNPSSTIGFERRRDPLLTEPDPKRFADQVLAAQKAAPPAFAEIYERNRRAVTVAAD